MRIRVDLEMIGGLLALSLDPRFMAIVRCFLSCAWTSWGIKSYEVLHFVSEISGN